MILERAVHQVENLADFRKMQAQVRQHVLVLRAFAGKHQREFALASERLAKIVNAFDRANARCATGLEALNRVLQLLGQLFARRGHDRQPRRAAPPAARSAVLRPGQIFQRGVNRSRGDSPNQPLRLNQHLLSRVARNHEQLTVPLVLQILGRMRASVLLEHCVRVDAAKSEGVDPGTPRRLARAVNPWPRFRIEIEVAFLKLQLGVGIFAMQRRRQHFMMQRERRFDQARAAGRRHRMADHGFHRADGAARRSRELRAENAAESLELDSIADRGSRAMRFDQFDGSWVDSRRVVSAPQRQFLALEPGRQ